MSDTGYLGQDNMATGSMPYGVLEFIVDQLVSRHAHVAWVKVVAVTGGTITTPAAVNVQPLVNMVDGQGQPTAHGVLYGLPALAWQAGTNGFIAAPVVGDIGLALFADRDTSIVKSTKKQANPGTRRRFDMGDGVYLGSILGPAVTQYVLLNGSGLTIHSPLAINITGGADITVTASGSLNLNGTLKINGDAYLAHEHTGVTAGSANTGGVV